MMTYTRKWVFLKKNQGFLRFANKCIITKINKKNISHDQNIYSITFKKIKSKSFFGSLKPIKSCVQNISSQSFTSHPLFLPWDGARGTLIVILAARACTRMGSQFVKFGLSFCKRDTRMIAFAHCWPPSGHTSRKRPRCRDPKHRTNALWETEQHRAKFDSHVPFLQILDHHLLHDPLFRDFSIKILWILLDVVYTWAGNRVGRVKKYI